MPPVNVNPGPRARFKAVAKWVSEHRQLIENPVLQRGLDYALLDYQRFLAELPFSESNATHFRNLGAIEFLEKFKTLAEESIIIPSAAPTGMKHGIK